MEKDDSSKSIDHDEKLSFCDIMKEDTSEIIKKMEFQIPVWFQNYSDMYTQYLHSLDDVFGTCYIAEKEFFDKLNIDQKVLKQIKKNSELIKNNYFHNIEMSSKLFDEYSKMRIDGIKMFDKYAHSMMEYYTKTLSQFTKSMESKLD